MVLAISAGSAWAAPATGSFGLNIDLVSSTTPLGTPSIFMIDGRYFVTKDMAVLAGIGLQINDSGAASNNKYTNIGLMGGIRKYLKTDEFAPFLGARIQYLSTRQAANDVTDFALMAEAGAEYFLGKQFSVEGSVGAGYASRESKPVGGTVTTKETGLGTTTYNVSVNYYF